MTDGFVRTIPEEELRRQKCRSLTIDGTEVVLVADGGTVAAFDNYCPHQQFSALHQGEVAGGTITCPKHGWTFDIRTGRNTNGNGRLKAWEVLIENGVVWVRRPADTPLFAGF